MSYSPPIRTAPGDFAPNEVLFDSGGLPKIQPELVPHEMETSKQRALNHIASGKRPTARRDNLQPLVCRISATWVQKPDPLALKFLAQTIDSVDLLQDREAQACMFASAQQRIAPPAVKTDKLGRCEEKKFIVDQGYDSLKAPWMIAPVDSSTLDNIIEGNEEVPNNGDTIEAEYQTEVFRDSVGALIYADMMPKD